ncbi:radical SAM protein [Pelodictyon luteolum]|uniref:Elongator protein 3/MiaB/NifB n=1 Tax=Chlorobium luteolum (strain DSM 273 / BCRC 81028 / 2530) TaxID=319225 RepID=Q3B2W2_CHLL3|nr:radical SAM protein [Pelodictyon luteolum]ABB24319.1 Elongator protein 3/MiaB/NifB [Pelodictyon luteolum DSM 273]
MKHVFGPVSSKRLGQSLGVDLLPPKSCTWNCIYCQLGRTRAYTLERKEFYPPEDILLEIQEALHSGARIDWITFVGSGETMLYQGIGRLIDEVKKMTDIPVAVITNGSLFSLPEVRSELLHADAVLPSLNAGSEELHQRISRPAPGFTFSLHLEGLRQFRREYSGRLWVEVMLLGGVNDSDEALQDIASALRSINPDMVHLVIPTRPSTEKDVLLPDEERIERAAAILAEVAPLVHPVKGSMDLTRSADLLEAVTAITLRHPVQQRELLSALEACFPDLPDKAAETLSAMFATGRFSLIEQGGEPYWTKREA